MYDRRVWAEVLQDTLRDLRHSLQREVERFTFELENWINWLVMKPLPVNWRQQTSDFLAYWETEGFLLSPYSKRVLDWWIEAWAKRRGFLPNDGHNAAANMRKTDDSMAMAQEADAPVKVQSDVSPPAKPASTTAPKQLKPPKNWPALSASEAEAAQESTGLPWWYPVQPRNRLDSVWQRHFEGLGRDVRDRLLAFFRELAALGRMARAINDPEHLNVEPLLAQQEKVQEAYNVYIQGRIDILDAWARYLSTEWFIGPEVSKVFGKIDNALPSRIEGIQSPLDDKLKRSRQTSHELTVKKRQRTESAYTALVWTDNVITAIEIATLLGSTRVIFKEAFKKAVAKGLSQTAARSVAIAYAVAHIGTAAASAAVIGGLVPKVLVDAGLDEAEVRAGLAVFRSLFTIVGIRAVGKQRVPTKQSAPDSPTSPATIPKSLQRKKKLSPEQARRAVGNAFNRAQASKYPYNEIRIVRPGGGSAYILDSYDPQKGEIVFRRDTQFSEIKPKTAMGYLNEFVRKYPPGRTIANVPSSRDLAGQVLRGRMIFEVPPQRKKIPSDVLKQATKLKITIRDSNGKVYE